jgi:hypothetical protein
MPDTSATPPKDGSGITPPRPTSGSSKPSKKPAGKIPYAGQELGPKWRIKRFTS